MNQTFQSYPWEREDHLGQTKSLKWIWLSTDTYERGVRLGWTDVLLEREKLLERESDV